MFLGGRGSVLLSFPLALLVGGGFAGRGMGGGLPLALLVGGGFAGRGMGGGRGEVWRGT